MDIESCSRKNLSAKEKYRAVPTVFFSIDERQKKLLLLMRGVNLTEVELRKYLRRRGITGERPIAESIAWSFDKPYSVGRFSDGSFPALYTSASRDICLSEVQHYLRPGQEREYIVYSILYSGSLRDVRPVSGSSGELLPEDHAGCQPIGKKCYLLGDEGIITFSKRKAGGSNCVVFSESSVSEGAVIESVDVRAA